MWARAGKWTLWNTRGRPFSFQQSTSGRALPNHHSEAAPVLIAHPGIDVSVSMSVHIVVLTVTRWLQVSLLPTTLTRLLTTLKLEVTVTIVHQIPKLQPWHIYMCMRTQEGYSCLIFNYLHTQFLPCMNFQHLYILVWVCVHCIYTHLAVPSYVCVYSAFRFL